MSSWKNTGTLAESFDVMPVGGAVVANVDGRNAVTFDGLTNRLVSSFAASASITGDSAYSAAVWVRNPKIEAEETLICWARRTSGDGKCAQLNYGSSPAFGAVTHWGVKDMGFDGGVPEPGKWHLIVVTYGGKADPVENVYVDGKVNASEKKTLDIAPGGSIYLGGADSEKLFSGAMASVQMYHYALSADEIASLMGAGGAKPKPALVNLSAEGLPSGDLSEWKNKGTLGGSFGKLKYAPTLESIDGRNAVSFSKGGWLRCASGLPSGAFTIELWARITQESAATSALSVGGVAKDDVLRLGLSREVKAGALASGAVTAGFNNPPSPKVWHQIAYAYSGDADPTLRIYVDGELDSERKCKLAIPSDAPIALGAAWQSGKGVPYAGFDGAISRLCIYGSALTQGEIRAHNGMLDAFNPSPAADSTIDKLETPLTWQTGGSNVKTCDVYFGVDSDAVASADKSSKLFKAGVPAAKTRIDGIKLAIGQTYYWRVRPDQQRQAHRQGQGLGIQRGQRQGRRPSA